MPADQRRIQRDRQPAAELRLLRRARAVRKRPALKLRVDDLRRGTAQRPDHDAPDRHGLVLGLTRPGQALGSPNYMAPEQIRGEAVSSAPGTYGSPTQLPSTEPPS